MAMWEDQTQVLNFRPWKSELYQFQPQVVVSRDSEDLHYCLPMAYDFLCIRHDFIKVHCRILSYSAKTDVVDNIAKKNIFTHQIIYNRYSKQFLRKITPCVEIGKKKESTTTSLFKSVYSTNLFGSFGLNILFCTKNTAWTLGIAPGNHPGGPASETQILFNNPVLPGLGDNLSSSIGPARLITCCNTQGSSIFLLGTQRIMHLNFSKNWWNTQTHRGIWWVQLYILTIFSHMMWIFWKEIFCDYYDIMGNNGFFCVVWSNEGILVSLSVQI